MYTIFNLVYGIPTDNLYKEFETKQKKLSGLEKECIYLLVSESDEFGASYYNGGGGDEESAFVGEEFSGIGLDVNHEPFDEILNKYNKQLNQVKEKAVEKIKNFVDEVFMEFSEDDEIPDDALDHLDKEKLKEKLVSIARPWFILSTS